ncbi:DUF2812 domain-containing protein [Clostridium algidicarnis]|uniref:DUF2812 domain-containing protein n=1 Tax=Clostridium algidicarnis TaxID=37659 RepID=UPI001C0E3413|nr:DUF2812 domain-containing protein [Clostridium algidicarnis]MBU3196683.1 DUF2812 domain-containing protein [Clostridium algidicarnis]MBU3227746.1 DUF2812 domain-containing protein [Clostridium algidicarnis]MBU3251498.1 DUF2812 domain-containing protein [Clostridium algidicarnis]
MRKFKFFINYDKEEKWLNDMAKKGYELETASFGYKFSFTKPQNTKIRIDYRIFKNKEDFMDYSALFEDSGWKHISGNKSCGAQYFKKIDENGDEDIFSDDMSKAARYKRLSDMWIGLAVVYLPISIALAFQKSIDIKSILNPKLLYYTPGLWEMSGISFWRRFLFETPFAAGRGLLWLVIPIALVLYICFSVKAKMLYYKQKNHN